VKQAGRYKFSRGRAEELSEAEAKAKAPDFLAEELKARVAAGPVKFRMIVQLPNAGDSTGSIARLARGSQDDRTRHNQHHPWSLTARRRRKGWCFSDESNGRNQLSDDPFPLCDRPSTRSFARRQQQ
jgi:hypothetical protein